MTDMIDIGVPMGEPLVCDKCNLPISDDKHIAIGELFGTTFGLVCKPCYDRVFRRDVERGVGYKLIRKYAKGEYVNAEDFKTITAIIQCPKCGLIVRDLGMVSQKEAEIALRTCPVCGRNVEK